MWIKALTLCVIGILSAPYIPKGFTNEREMPRERNPWLDAKVITVGENGLFADLHRAVERAQGPTIIRIKPGRYVYDRELLIDKSDIMITAEEKVEIVVRCFREGDYDRAAQNGVPFMRIGGKKPCSNIRIEGITFRFEKTGESDCARSAILLYPRDVDGFTVHRCDIAGFAEAVNLGTCRDVRITANSLRNEYDIVFLYVEHLLVTDNRMRLIISEDSLNKCAVGGAIMIKNNVIVR